MEYIYKALQVAAAYGGGLYCLYCMIFRWSAVTRRYGRIDLYFWVVCNTVVFYVLAVATMFVVWQVQLAIWRLQNGT